MDKAFQLKGSLFTLTILELYTSDLSTFQHQLQLTIEAAPKFFDHAPVVIDLTHLPETVDFTALQRTLAHQRLILTGIKGGTRAQQTLAKQAGLALFSHSKTTSKKTKATQSSNVYHRLTKTVHQPVRSGQQIYAPGDLIVTAAVSPGAELLAEGHIHIYGPLRGRALAGISGDDTARIFCQALQAELVAIAGIYQVNEAIQVPQQKYGFEIKLKDQQIQICGL